ncbi:hypothetical protein RFZ45_04265, partial [Acinetobacter baumannii]|nr:hypothetical protein [Acinetobacter baumannii]
VTDHNVDFKDAVALIACDFDKNGVISSSDTTIISKASISLDGITQYPYCDLDGNKMISSSDSVIVNVLSINNVEY